MPITNRVTQWEHWGWGDGWNCLASTGSAASPTPTTTPTIALAMAETAAAISRQKELLLSDRSLIMYPRKPDGGGRGGERTGQCGCGLDFVYVEMYSTRYRSCPFSHVIVLFRESRQSV
jgi:hypothetical protein